MHLQVKNGEQGILGRERILRLLGRLIDQELTVSFSREAWRYTGPFTRWNRFKGAFPGLGIATVAFAGYLIYEAVFLNKPHGGHAEKDSEEQH